MAYATIPVRHMPPTASAAEAPAPVSFYVRLAGAFAYPLGVDGIFMVILGGVFLWLASVAALFGIRTGLFGVFIVGYMLTFGVKVAHATGDGKDEVPNWPSITDGVVSTFFYLLGTILLSASPIALYGAAWWFLDAPLRWMILPLYATLVFLPMAILRVAMFNTIEALHPFKVVGAILRVPTPYAAICLAVYLLAAVRVAAGLVLQLVPFLGSVLEHIFAFYLFLVTMRMLGLLYYSYEDRLDWFSDIA